MAVMDWTQLPPEITSENDELLLHIILFIALKLQQSSMIQYDL